MDHLSRTLESGDASPDHHHMGSKDWKTILRISSFSRANSSFCSSVQPGTTGSGQLHPARALSGDPELPTYLPGGCPATVVVCCMLYTPEHSPGASMLPSFHPLWPYRSLLPHSHTPNASTMRVHILPADSWGAGLDNEPLQPHLLQANCA